jgi:acyl dehydratase
VSNLDHADFISNVQDADSHPRDTYTSDDDAAMYQIWLDRQRATADAAIANAAELTKLAPLTATCRPVPVQPFADLAGVFDKPVRPTIAARVADHVAGL